MRSPTLPSDGRVSVIAAGETARVVANEATDRGRATRADRWHRASNGSGDMTDALRLADALAARARGAQILVVTDDAGSAAPTLHPRPPCASCRSAASGDNQAIAALAVADRRRRRQAQPVRERRQLSMPSASNGGSRCSPTACPSRPATSTSIR